MFDPFYEFVARLLAFCYELVPDYALAIMLLTVLVMVVTTPLTLKGTRSMIKMQQIQPQLRRLQKQHAGDRQKLNEELMKFYQEEGINPVGGCLPLLAQAPVFLLLYGVIRGLTRTSEGVFDPRYLPVDSSLFQDLAGDTDMTSFGLDLARSTTQAWNDGILQGLPYILLILLMAGATYLQQRQISARSAGGEMLPQQKIIQYVFPVVFPLISLGFPAALVIYWVTSNIYRIGLQFYITRSMYSAENSPGKQAQKAAAEARKVREAEKKSSGGNTRSTGHTSGSQRPHNARPAPRSGSSRPHPRSKKKKKRR